MTKNKFKWVFINGSWHLIGGCPPTAPAVNFFIQATTPAVPSFKGEEPNEKNTGTGAEGKHLEWCGCELCGGVG